MSDPGFQINLADLAPLTEKEENKELDARFAVPNFKTYDKTFRIEKQSELEEFARLVLDGKLG